MNIGSSVVGCRYAFRFHRFIFDFICCFDSQWNSGFDTGETSGRKHERRQYAINNNYKLPTHTSTERPTIAPFGIKCILGKLFDRKWMCSLPTNKQKFIAGLDNVRLCEFGSGIERETEANESHAHCTWVSEPNNDDNKNRGRTTFNDEENWIKKQKLHSSTAATQNKTETRSFRNKKTIIWNEYAIAHTVLVGITHTPFIVCIIHSESEWTNNTANLRGRSFCMWNDEKQNFHSAFVPKWQ